MEPFIGEIRMFAGNFAPRGWAFCDGQLLAVEQNAALFSILGTTYGGDGRSTFALPDLRGRAPIHAGTGPGLTQRRLGEKGGAETVTPKKKKARKARKKNPIRVAAGAPVDNMPPFCAVNYIIAIAGVFPSRS